jgi:uncharacterized membrane protein YdjX (TVP38/TMEM64 family)
MDLKKKRNSSSSFAMILLFAMVSGIAAVFLLRYFGFISFETIATFIKSKRAAAPYLMLLLYAVSPALILPTFYLTLLAGMLWGPIWGVIFDICGATTGSVIAFSISRYLASDFIRNKITNKTFNRLLDSNAASGWKLNAFLRLNPIFPSALIGYFFGLTSIGRMEFIISTSFFLLPPCIAVVSLGSSLTEFLNNNLHGLSVKITILIVSLLLWFLLAGISKKKQGTI